MPKGVGQKRSEVQIFFARGHGRDECLVRVVRADESCGQFPHPVENLFRLSIHGRILKVLPTCVESAAPPVVDAGQGLKEWQSAGEI